VEDHKVDGVEMRDVDIDGMKGRSTPVYRTSFFMLQGDIHDEASVSNLQKGSAVRRNLFLALLLCYVQN
jgi:hypothetical protein